MSESAITAFSGHAAAYDALRRRLVPCFDQFYGSALELLSLRAGDLDRILDLGAGTGLLSQLIAARHPRTKLLLVDGSEEMLEEARVRLERNIVEFRRQDLRASLPAGPFDAIVSALAIHHLEHTEQRDLIARASAELAPGGVFVAAEQIAAKTPALERRLRALWISRCSELGASSAELRAAQQRMTHDRCTDCASLLSWMQAAGLVDCECFFRSSSFGVFAGWKPESACT